MNKKQIDRMYDGIKLTDEQLDFVIGGVNLPAKQAVASAPQLNMLKAMAKPLYKK